MAHQLSAHLQQHACYSIGTRRKTPNATL